MHALAYDKFEQSNFEALVMERAPGKVLQHDIFEMTEADLQVLFKQILSVVRQLSQIPFSDFGPISQLDRSFPTFEQQFVDDFRGNLATIRRDQLANETDIARIESYVLDRVNVFQGERPVFVHTDLHMGNIMHDGTTLTSIIDFDHSHKAPAMMELTTLLSFIGAPQQFVEGRPEFAQYKGKQFLHLIPILKGELPALFADPNLIQKLNLLYLKADMSLISENWSAKGNATIMRDVLTNGLAETDDALSRTFYGRTLSAQ